MNQSELKTVIVDQQKFLDISGTVLRDVLPEIGDLLKLKHIIVIKGPRRCGKSTLMYQIIKHYYKKNPVYYMNFDDERLRNLTIDDFQVLLESFHSLFGESKVIFLDEIQNVSKWELFVSRLYNEKYKIFITGSNANLLSSELSTHLTGRHIDINLTPFSFKEIISMNNIELSENNLYKTSTKGKINRLLTEYLLNGGFPEFIFSKDSRILQYLIDDIVNKDIISYHSIRETETFRHILRFTLSNFSNTATSTSIKNTFSLGSVHTAKDYVSYIEQAYLISILRSYSSSLKKISRMPYKIYAIDNGMANVAKHSQNTDIGRLTENAVYLKLHTMFTELFYWKDRYDKEVDFIVSDRNEKHLIQVCHKLDDPKTRDRELKALLSAGAYFNINDGILINETEEKIEKVSSMHIHYIPLWKFLLFGENALHS